MVPFYASSEFHWNRFSGSHTNNVGKCIFDLPQGLALSLFVGRTLLAIAHSSTIKTPGRACFLLIIAKNPDQRPIMSSTSTDQKNNKHTATLKHDPFTLDQVKPYVDDKFDAEVAVRRFFAVNGEASELIHICSLSSSSSLIWE